MTGALQGLAIGYAAITACIALAWLVVLISFVPLMALDDPADAREMVKEAASPVLAFTFGWPLLPFFLLAGMYRLVAR